MVNVYVEIQIEFSCWLRSSAFFEIFHPGLHFDFPTLWPTPPFEFGRNILYCPQKKHQVLKHS